MNHGGNERGLRADASEAAVPSGPQIYVLDCFPEPNVAAGVIRVGWNLGPGGVASVGGGWLRIRCRMATVWVP